MARLDKKIVWKDTLESIKVSVSDAIFSTWFVHTHLSSIKTIDGRSIVEVGCPSSFVKTTIESRYYGLIQDSLKKTLDGPCDLTFVIKQAPSKPVAQDTIPTPLFEKENGEEEFVELLVKSGIRLGFSFANYAVSSSNQMAWAAAEAVANDPGKAYNPLFVWGGVGVGKTHLMTAVGYSIAKNNLESKIIYCTGEGFTNDIVEGIRNKTTQQFRNKYRRLKALLIDDIQFIAGKNTVQEEFFHTFNTLVANGAQIILTSDQPPSDISRLEERLRSRFEAGLIVDISSPDFELRCAIIQIKSKERGIDIPMDLVQLIAGNVESARRIEGIIIRILSEAKLRKSPITENLIESVLGKKTEINGPLSKTTPLEFISAVSRYFSVGKRALLGPTRARPIARPRQILMYLLRTQLGLPLQEVGRLVGGRDHTTVMYAVDKITHLASEDVQLRTDIRGIKNML